MTYHHSVFVSAQDETRLFVEIRKAESRAPLVPVVLLDGIGCDGFAWKYLAEGFARERDVYHLHYRGHGRSGAPVNGEKIDIPTHAQDALSLLDHFRLPGAIMVGHSMGTQVALEVFNQRPEAVSGMALLCGSHGNLTSTVRGTDLLKQVLPTMIDYTSNHLGLVRGLWSRMPVKLSYHVAKWTGDLGNRAMREEDFRWYLKHVSAMDPALFLPMLRAAGEHDAAPILSTIHLPVLVVAAERDTFSPSYLAKQTADAIVGARYLELKGASHGAPVEQPEVILKAFSDLFGAEDKRV